MQSMSFYESWQYLNNLEAVVHEDTNYFYRCLAIEVVKINPKTDAIDDNNDLNTKEAVWLEFGGVTYDSKHKVLHVIHDMDLDCGADTFEAAIIKLAVLCKEKNYK